MKRWITRNGKRVLINTTVSGIDESYFNKDKEDYLTASELNRRFVHHSSFKKPVTKSAKKWHEEGWRHEVYRFGETGYAIDLGNFGKGSFSFSVRKGQKEIFVIPPSLLKQAVSCGLATLGLPAIDMTMPIGVIEESIKLYNNF